MGRLVTVAILTLVLLGMGGQAPRGAEAANSSVNILNFEYLPPDLTISVGSSVTWTNQDPAPHTATADDGAFDTGTINKGQSRTLTFSKAGTFAYMCGFHPFMHATITVTAVAPPVTSRAFPETGFTIDNPAFLDYFTQRGGLPTFGYPTSRTFQFEGFTTQFFQRQVMQQLPDGSVQLLNLLDPGLLPYTTFNFSTFPAYNAAMVAQLPVPGTAGYSQAVQAYVAANAPDSWQGVPVKFGQTFRTTVSAAQAFPTLAPADPQVTSLLPLIELEIWGVPTSAPAFDPNNHSFVYLRWQRGVMQYDAGCDCTQGVLLADYLKAILTGNNLPDDLAREAAGSPLLRQYNPAKPLWINQPAMLTGTDLTHAFEPQLPR